MAGDTVNVYSDSDVQGALVTGDDIAEKLLENHNNILLINLFRYSKNNIHASMQGSLLT